MITGVMYQTEGMGLKEMCHTLRSNLHRRVINDYGVMYQTEGMGLNEMCHTLRSSINRQVCLSVNLPITLLIQIITVFPSHRQFIFFIAMLSLMQFYCLVE
jgi:hypothetical protein